MNSTFSSNISSISDNDLIKKLETKLSVFMDVKELDTKHIVNLLKVLKFILRKYHRNSNFAEVFLKYLSAMEMLKQQCHSKHMMSPYEDKFSELTSLCGEALAVRHLEQNLSFLVEFIKLWILLTKGVSNPVKIQAFTSHSNDFKRLVFVMKQVEDCGLQASIFELIIRYCCTKFDAAVLPTAIEIFEDNGFEEVSDLLEEFNFKSLKEEMQKFINKFNKANKTQILQVYAENVILRCANRFLSDRNCFYVPGTQVEFNLNTRDISFSVKTSVLEKQNDDNAVVQLKFNAENVSETIIKASKNQTERVIVFILKNPALVSPSGLLSNTTNITKIEINFFQLHKNVSSVNTLIYRWFAQKIVINETSDESGLSEGSSEGSSGSSSEASSAGSNPDDKRFVRPSEPAKTNIRKKPILEKPQPSAAILEFKKQYVPVAQPASNTVNITQDQQLKSVKPKPIRLVNNDSNTATNKAMDKEVSTETKMPKRKQKKIRETSSFAKQNSQSEVLTKPHTIEAKEKTIESALPKSQESYVEPIKDVAEVIPNIGKPPEINNQQASKLSQNKTSQKNTKTQSQREIKCQQTIVQPQKSEPQKDAEVISNIQSQSEVKSQQSHKRVPNKPSRKDAEIVPNSSQIVNQRTIVQTQRERAEEDMEVVQDIQSQPKVKIIQFKRKGTQKDTEVTLETQTHPTVKSNQAVVQTQERKPKKIPTKDEDFIPNIEDINQPASTQIQRKRPQRNTEIPAKIQSYSEVKSQQAIVEIQEKRPKNISTKDEDVISNNQNASEAVNRQAIARNQRKRPQKDTELVQNIQRKRGIRGQQAIVQSEQNLPNKIPRNDLEVDLDIQNPPEFDYQETAAQSQKTKSNEIPIKDTSLKVPPVAQKIPPKKATPVVIKTKANEASEIKKDVYKKVESESKNYSSSNGETVATKPTSKPPIRKFFTKKTETVQKSKETKKVSNKTTAKNFLLNKFEFPNAKEKKRGRNATTKNTKNTRSKALTELDVLNFHLENSPIFANKTNVSGASKPVPRKRKLYSKVLMDDDSDFESKENHESPKKIQKTNQVAVNDDFLNETFETEKISEVTREQKKEKIIKHMEEINKKSSQNNKQPLNLLDKIQMVENNKTVDTNHSYSYSQFVKTGNNGKVKNTNITVSQTKTSSVRSSVNKSKQGSNDDKRVESNGSKRKNSTEADGGSQNVLSEVLPIDDDFHYNNCDGFNNNDINLSPEDSNQQNGSKNGQGVSKAVTKPREEEWKQQLTAEFQKYEIQWEQSMKTAFERFIIDQKNLSNLFLNVIWKILEQVNRS